MNPTAIFSKTGKGVQEASGKTSNLSRGDRAVLKEIDGKTALANVAAKFEKLPADKFDALIAQFDKDGYIREVSSGATAPQAPQVRSAAPAKAAPPPASGDDEMDFTQAIKLPPKPPAAAPKAPAMDLAAASRAEAERKEKDQQAFDFKGRQEAELKAKAQAEAKAKAEAQARARALAEAKAKAEAEAKAKTEAEARARAAAAATEAKTLAEAEAKVKAAREAAIRMATEAKAKAEAEGKAKTDAAEGREREALEKARKESEDKAKLEAELKGKLEEERRAREDAERRAAEAAGTARKELEEKSKRDADELRQRLETEMKAKLDEERKAREEEDRKRREEEDRKRAEEDRKRREDDERRRKEEEERRAKEDAERRAREEEDRKRREEDERRRKEEDERRAKEDAERRAREEAEREADRKRREEEDRKRAEDEKRRKEEDERRAKEDAERRGKEEAERRAKEDSERRAKEDAERRAKEDSERRAKEDAERRAKEEADRKARDDADARARAAQVASAQSSSTPSIPAVAPPPPSDGGIGDSLLADLDSFGKREEEEQKAKEEAERAAKEEAARKAKAEAERKAKEEADRRAKEEAEKKRREEEERKEKEDAERRAREEEERQKQEEADRKRKAKEALAAKEAERKAAQQATAAKTAAKTAPKTAAKGPAADDDIDVSDDDLDMDEVKKDEKALSATARKAAVEREQAAAAMAPVRRPKKWGKPAAIAFFVILIGGVGALQLMPVSTSEYEKAASDAMGVPVKIGSARLSVLTGIEARFEGVSVGESVKIKTVHGYPEVGSLFGSRKSFTRIELEGVSLSQSQLGDAVLGKIGSENFRVARIVIKQAKFDGPLALPALDVDAAVSGDGSLQSVTLRGADKLSVQLAPKGSEIGFEIAAGSLALPFAPALTLSDFSMKGTANRGGVTSSEFDGRAADGVITGSAKIRWGANWTVDGEIRVRNLKVAVLAPALVSEGKAEARGAYSMSGPKPASLFEGARIQGDFKIEQGVLGSFDLTRALQTGGTQSSGRTIFTELTGQAVYDKGAIKITNAALSAGAMNAGASLDIDAGGGLSGRIAADVKTPNQTLRATLNISGKIQDPVIRK